MKIQIITENYLIEKDGRWSVLGGAEYILYDLCQLLKKKGHKAIVIQSYHVSKEVEHDGIPVRLGKVPRHVRLEKIGISRRFHYNGFYWKRYAERDADWTHFHYYYSGFPYGGPRDTGMSHGIDWDCPEYKQKKSLRSYRDRFHFRTMKWITGQCLKKLERIIANDLFFLKYVQSEYPQWREKVVHIPNYYDEKLFHPNVEPDFNLLDRFQGKIKILLPKMPSINRGTDIAIQSIALLNRKDIVLWIVGESPERPFFERMAHDYQVQDQVIFFGHRDHFKDMPSIYSASDIVIVPSLCREATALSMIEGMACQKPVIVSNIGGLTDVVVDGYNGRTCHPKADAFAETLHEVLNHPDTPLMAKRGREWVENNYSKPLWEKRILNFFQIPDDRN